MIKDFLTQPEKLLIYLKIQMNKRQKYNWKVDR